MIFDSPPHFRLTRVSVVGVVVIVSVVVVVSLGVAVVISVVVVVDSVVVVVISVGVVNVVVVIGVGIHQFRLLSVALRRTNSFSARFSSFFLTRWGMERGGWDRVRGGRAVAGVF